MKLKNFKCVACLLLVIMLVCDIPSVSLMEKVGTNSVISHDKCNVYAATNSSESNITGRTFFFLGSSVTYGYASGGVSFADYIAQRNNCTSVKEAVSGTTLVDNGSSSYVQRLKNNFDVLADCDHFICQLSTNDASQNKPLGTMSSSYNLNDFDTSTIMGAMEYIICYAKTNWNCPVSFYTGTYYDSANYQAMVNALYQLQGKWGIGIIDLWNNEEMRNVSSSDYSRYMADNIHPTAAGYLEWWTPQFEKFLENFDYSKYEHKGFERIEAENYYEASSNIVIDPNSSASGSKNIGGVRNGNYTEYNKVEFDKAATYMNICYSSSSNDAKGQAEIYVDSMDGAPVGTIELTSTGTNWSVYNTVQCKLSSVVKKGRHQIFVKFVNDGTKAYVANVDWIEFTTCPSSFDAMDRIEAEAYAEGNGVVIDNNSNGEPSNIGGITTGKSAKYENVVFSKRANEMEICYSSISSAIGYVKVYVDSINSTPVGVIEITKTGDYWADYSTKTVKLNTMIGEGTHTIYLGFEKDSGYIANVDWFRFNGYNNFIDGGIEIHGYQVSATTKGLRTVYSVDDTINGKKVVNSGIVYSLADLAKESELYVGSTNYYVRSYASTTDGKMDTTFAESDIATSYAMTMKFTSKEALEYTDVWRIRAYAQLSDGTYVYTDPYTYCVYEIADILYTNRKMGSREKHEFLYDDILSVVDKKYKKIEYEWNDSIIGVK